MSHRENLEELGNKILEASRTELFLSMRFMGSALDSLSYVMDLTTRTVGTDAVFIRFNPEYLMRLYLMKPVELNRQYVHMLLHCIFRHMFGSNAYEDKDLYALCADIAVEAVIDSMEYSAIEDIHSDFRSLWYEKLEREVKFITAERLYKYFTDAPPQYDEYMKLKSEFTKDDHGFWELLDDQKQDDEGNEPPEQNASDSGENQPPDAPENEDKKEAPLDPPQKHHVARLPKELEEEWKKNADRMKVEMESSGHDASDEAGSLLRTLRFVQKRRKSYKNFLKRFAAMHEETKIDPDSFDYGFYQYGMELFGNIPLVEENEYRESRKIKTLVIAIDTSASCQETLIQRFLNETADILDRQESFFHRADILILECDDRVQEEIYLKDPGELKRFAEGFKVRGGYGTDFRPAFRRVEELVRSGRLKDLKGMMYFTDGFGTFSEKKPGWDTAIVLFGDEACETEKLPDWAYVLYLEGDS